MTTVPRGPRYLKGKTMFASLHTSALTLARVQRRGGPGILARLRDAFALAAQRRQLAQLDDALLADIGLTREQALREARRPLWDGVPSRWDAPHHWIARPVPVL